LLEYFAKFHAAPDQSPITFSAEFHRALQNYQWPGNVRELSNLIDRFSTLFSGECLDFHTLASGLLPKGLAAMKIESFGVEERLSLVSGDGVDEGAFTQDGLQEVALLNDEEKLTMLSQAMPILPPEGFSLKHRLAEIERDLISQALNRTNGNVSQTARILNLQRTTLIEKIQKFGLRPT
jgi:sigma-54 specific flagellar transcriptional regulator A